MAQQAAESRSDVLVCGMDFFHPLRLPDRQKGFFCSGKIRTVQIFRALTFFTVAREAAAVQIIQQFFGSLTVIHQHLQAEHGKQGFLIILQCVRRGRQPCTQLRDKNVTGFFPVQYARGDKTMPGGELFRFFRPAAFRAVNVH